MRLLKKHPKETRLYLDIETVSQFKEIDPEANPQVWQSWEYKSRYSDQRFDTENLAKFYQEKSPLYAEFGKIVCISLGYYGENKEGEEEFRTHSYCSDDEAQLLRDFNKAVKKFAGTSKTDKNNSKDRGRGIDVFTGFSIVGFDLGYIFKRMIVNGILPHELLDFSDRKPWEIAALDLKTLWQGPSFYTASLINVAVCLGIPSPKETLSGDEVSSLYWSDGDREEILSKIKDYCERDVKAVEQIFNIIENKLQ